MLLDSYDQSQADYTDSVQQNLGGALDQLRSMRIGAINDYQQNITRANNSRANPFAVGLKIAGAGIDLLGSQAFKKPGGLGKTSKLPPAPDIGPIDLSGIRV